MAVRPKQGRSLSARASKQIQEILPKGGSIFGRFQRGNSGNEKNRISGGSGASSASQEADEGRTRRKVFFNLPLPEEAHDEDGRPLAHYERNKIRTAKYTALSFIPKNLWYQFHNIANVYFLFLIILGIFAIFGASNPALNAAPLIIILFVTAVKDGVEDWRRGTLDDELNNSPVRRLVDFVNVNVASDDISLWRRIKKATSHGLANFWRLIKAAYRKKRNKGRKEEADVVEEDPRVSIDTRRTPRPSMMSNRTSYYSVASPTRDEGIQMTPVSSPSPRTDHLAVSKRQSHVSQRSSGAFSAHDVMSEPVQGERPRGNKRDSFHPVERDYGNLINPAREAPEKASFKKDFWKNVQVGDFVRIFNNEQVPADIIILATSEEDGGCFVETKNLDGETNLKPRMSLRCGREIRHPRQCEQAEFIIDSEPPHANLYQYEGTIRWQQRSRTDHDAEPTEMVEPITIGNLLLRGSSVQNTKWVLGVVLFTGRETKIMLNAGITPSKRSRIARELNWNVIYNFIILFVMCVVSGAVNGVAWGSGGRSLNYFDAPYGSTAGLDGFITFWTTVILFQNLVPISLYITLEIIKTLQAFFIYSDVGMYYDKLDYPCTPKSWNISDDMGQVEYIFSDKTGTLTQNVMEFKKCSINGVPYGEAYTEAQAGMQRRQGIDVEAEAAKANKQIAEDRVKMLADLRKMHDNPYLHDDLLTFVAPDYVEDLRGVHGEEQARANYDFTLALALCHSVLAEMSPDDPPTIEFKAQSPDEAALVATARDCGFTVKGRHGDDLVVNIHGRDQKYRILNELEFNSTRKRMSVIVRMPDRRIVLFCKGADSMIYSRLRRGEQQELKKSTAEHLEMFAREGLRTLCLARRELGEDEYRAWNRNYDRAVRSEGREEKIEVCADAIERDLTLLGGTAIEDRLQDGVPDTIALLGQAGIKLWVLTGDKVETAINIGFSCNLLGNDMDLIVLKLAENDVAGGLAELDKHLTHFGMTGSDAELQAARQDHGAPAPTHALIIDGDSLKAVLHDELRQKFLLLCKQCKSVLCCRVSPSQKAAVVTLVKGGLDVITLSVGDGANDVAMIQEADIGVGIAGEEGRQAVMSSDYAIGQFRFLQRLVLVHGRWSYRRLAETIANFFYKNMVWTFVLFWYQLYCDFDGSYVWDYSYIVLYNLAFTSLPIIFMGILDQDVSDKVSLAVPYLYRRGIERKEWTQPKFWLYMLDGIYQSVMCFFITYLVFQPGLFATGNGRDVESRLHMGVFMAHAAVVTVNVYILLNTYRWDWLMLTLSAFSVLLIWFWTGVYTSSTYAGPFYGAGAQSYGQLSFWAILLLTTIICLVPRFTVKSFQKIYRPMDVDIIREQVRQGRFKDLDDLPPDTSGAKLIDQAVVSSEEASDTSAKPAKSAEQKPRNRDDDTRPIYPPSTAPNSTIHHGSANGSDSTDATGWRRSADRNTRPFTPMHEIHSRSTSLAELDRPRPSFDRPRPSFDRVRSSMDIIRPSFEASQDLTTANRLMRVESSHSNVLTERKSPTPSNLR